MSLYQEFYSGFQHDVPEAIGAKLSVADFLILMALNRMDKPIQANDAVGSLKGMEGKNFYNLTDHRTVEKFVLCELYRDKDILHRKDYSFQIQDELPNKPVEEFNEYLKNKYGDDWNLTLRMHRAHNGDNYYPCAYINRRSRLNVSEKRDGWLDSRQEVVTPNTGDIVQILGLPRGEAIDNEREFAGGFRIQLDEFNVKLQEDGSRKHYVTIKFDASFNGDGPRSLENGNTPKSRFEREIELKNIDGQWAPQGFEEVSTKQVIDGKQLMETPDTAQSMAAKQLFEFLMKRDGQGIIKLGLELYRINPTTQTVSFEGLWSQPKNTNKFGKFLRACVTGYDGPNTIEVFGGRVFDHTHTITPEVHQQRLMHYFGVVPYAIASFEPHTHQTIFTPMRHIEEMKTRTSTEALKKSIAEQKEVKRIIDKITKGKTSKESDPRTTTLKHLVGQLVSSMLGVDKFTSILNVKNQEYPNNTALHIADIDGYRFLIENVSALIDDKDKTQNPLDVVKRNRHKIEAAIFGKNADKYICTAAMNSLREGD